MPNLNRLAKNTEPICGVDFCQECGACLACYGETKCYYSADGEHMSSERMIKAQKKNDK